MTVKPTDSALLVSLLVAIALAAALSLTARFPRTPTGRSPDPEARTM